MAEGLGELDITVVSTGNERGSPQTELRMIKAALLYADKVTLVSPTPTTYDLYYGQEYNRVAPMLLLGDLWSKRRRDVGDSMDIYRRVLIFGEELSDADRESAALDGDDPDQILAEMRERIRGLKARDGWADFDCAVEAGALEVQPVIGISNTSAVLEQAAIERAAEVFLLAGESSAPSYPLMHWWDWMVITHRGVAFPSAAPLSEAAMAERILSGLECFPEAPMDEVLDVRRGLEGPRARFRAALGRLSADMPRSAFGADFDRELAIVYRREIAPALAELDETLRDLGARSSLRRAGAAAVKSLGIAAAELAVFSEVFASALTPLASAAGSEIKYRLDVGKRRRENDFFFIWEANRQLGSNSPDGRH
jgi:hypothetical protein